MFLLKALECQSSISSAKVAVHPILPIYRGISNFRSANTMAEKKLGMTRVPYEVGTLVYGMEVTKSCSCTANHHSPGRTVT